MNIKIAENDSEIMGCFDIMHQLRPHIKKEDFLSIVKRQGESGYRLAYVEDNNKAVSVAGFRIDECLAFGKFLFVDDLVTDENERSKRYGDKLFDWLKDFAIENSCKEFHLDSAVHRFDAHRFYFRKRLSISCYHFDMALDK